MNRITLSEISQIAKDYGLTKPHVQAVIDVESGGRGFSDDGKIIIQFEPIWFKRKSPYTPSGKWSVNKVEKQAAEWIAFNDAFKRNPSAAMESTSIGMMQVMGFHWFSLGFKSVGDMWDYAKIGEANQVRLGMKFISLNRKMHEALRNSDFATFAYYYNGEQYRKFNCDNRLRAAYNKHMATD